MINILVTDDIDKEAIIKLKALKFNIVEKHYTQDVLGEILKDSTKGPQFVKVIKTFVVTYFSCLRKITIPSKKEDKK